MQTKVAILKEIGEKLNIEKVELQDPKKGQLLVRITNSGVCHTDEAARKGELLGPAFKPAVLGHEGAGIVEKVGEGVTDFAPGDHVIITYASCGECEFCKKGQTSLCDNFMFLNFAGVQEDGSYSYSQDETNINNFFGMSSFGMHAVVKETSCVKVPETADLGTLAPLGCGFLTGAGSMIDFLKPEEGDTAVVYGCGAVGFAGIMAAKIAGCKNIIAVGGNQWKLDLALEIGATHVINRKETPDIADEIRKIVPGGAEVHMDTSGNIGMIQQAINSLAREGRIACVAVMKDPVVPVNMTTLMNTNSWIGSCLEGNTDNRAFLKKMIAWYEEGKFPVDKLITHYAFEDINDAFDALNSGKIIKAVLDM